jgi:anthranilate synthase/aminodeoxychorismate synthase-like glutamine amidotransferase
MRDASPKNPTACGLAQNFLHRARSQDTMLLLIDNYDSFVHNLARYFERLGQTTLVMRNNAVDLNQVRAMRPLAIVLSPGPCTPTEAGASLDIVRSLHRDIPILGVCLGHQVIAQAFGGNVVRARIPIHGRSSPIRHDATGMFAELPSPLEVGRYHSLVVEPQSLPQNLRATAWTDDGVLMAFEHVDLPVYGVQFHPESILTARGYDLLANFLRLSGLPVPIDAHQLATSELVERPKRHTPMPTRPVTF